ncbi:citrate lyase subunit alpha [Azotosporobacter soli]|uniref:citrate lyase subunit alpha n=1 Tax=Azotosporobacter soli TaxID=3055040 RepID=UPI0031FF2875
MSNEAKRNLPDFIEGYGPVKPYRGPFATAPSGRRSGGKIALDVPHSEKLLRSIDQAIEAVGLQDGMTISFHHHFRSGDHVPGLVLAAIARKGIRNLTLAPSSLHENSDILIPLLEQGVVTAIQTSGGRGEVGRYITHGRLAKPTIFRSHGGRPRALASGELVVDVAFLGAPTCDIYGNINGVHGKSACGSLGYAMVDAAHADKVVAITDNLVQQPIFPISIPQDQVDFIVEVDSIGDPAKIATKVLRFTTDPRELLIAQRAAAVMEHSGLFQDGFSFQLGGGGASMAVARYIKEKMLAHKISGGFGLGGIGGVFAQMMEEGLFRMAFDAQSFDLAAVESLKKNPNHLEISASQYANPHTKGPLVNRLDMVFLGATEVDVDFNVNGLTDSNGMVMGASGGQSDTAAGAKLTVVCAPLLRGRLPIVRERVHTVVTPGETVDVIVTDYGVAVNPRRQDILARLKDSPLEVMAIEDLQRKALELTGVPDSVPVSDKIVGVVEYRDGTVIDVIRRPE